MKSLIERFDPQDKKVRNDISRIDNVLHSDIFLKALGNQAQKLTLPQDFPICQNYLKAAEMLVSETIYDTPKPWVYQCFMEIYEEENGRIYFKSGLDNLKSQEISAHIRAKKGDNEQFDQYILDLVNTRYIRYQISETLTALEISVDNVEDWLHEPAYVVNNIFLNEIYGWIDGLIDASYYCGLENSPFYHRICEAFETGGIPAGWIGPKPDEGGKPEDCLQLLHYGKAETL